MRLLTIALLIIAVLAVQSFATSVTVSTTNLQTKYGTLTNVYFETASGPGSSTPSTNTAQTPSGTSGSYSIPQATSGYLWSPQFVSATTVSAGNWVFDFWAAAAAYSYVPITLTNNQGSATPNTLQVIVQPNPSLYSAYETSDLGNIGFCLNTLCSTKLYSWLEGCGSAAPYGPCSTASTTATFWVKLTSSLAGSGGSLTIYMVFLPTSTEFDGAYRGESPHLSTTYAAYDNGANVFDLYFNGNTAVASFNNGASNTLAKTTGVANPIAGGSSINVLSLKGYGSSNRVNMILTTPLPAANPTYGEIAESYSEIQTGDAGNLQGLAGFCDSTTAGSGTINAESEVVGNAGTLYGYVYVAAGAATKVAGGGVDAALTWYYAGLAYPGTGSTSFSGIVSTSFYSAYAASTPQHPITGSAQLYWCSVGASVAGNPDGLYFNWGRARASPPGGALPAVSLGSLSSNKVTVSIYITGSTGTVVTTVASNVPSSVLGTAEAQYTMTFAEATVSVPANDYLSVVVTASSSAATLYWGVGQPTNFQVPLKVLT
ncbi:MAG: hypothetical protein OK438_00960 [Thaumarchaeota archaeon]|nr:hypothetical protein [Nitrososphaerota archaeon]